MMLRSMTYALLGAFALSLTPSSSAAGKAEKQLAHIVYFTLKEKSAENQKKLIDACNKYLSNHPGTVFYGTGGRATDLKRGVNVTDWDVGLHIVFKNKAAHDKYQVSKRHLQFIKENKDLWSKVRVFDSYIQPIKTAAGK